MTWRLGLMCLFGGITSLALAVWLIEREVRKGPGRIPNRRTRLPAPRYDERSSIEQFKRMHSV